LNAGSDGSSTAAKDMEEKEPRTDKRRKKKSKYALCKTRHSAGQTSKRRKTGEMESINVKKEIEKQTDAKSQSKNQMVVNKIAR